MSLNTVDSPYLTFDEAKDYLRLKSGSALYWHIYNGRLPYCRVGRSYRFDKRELDAWMRGHDSAIEMKRSLRAVK
jgi:excisionase family DNA binding protein